MGRTIPNCAADGRSLDRMSVTCQRPGSNVRRSEELGTCSPPLRLYGLLSGCQGGPRDSPSPCPPAPPRHSHRFARSLVRYRSTHGHVFRTGGSGMDEMTTTGPERAHITCDNEGAPSWPTPPTLAPPTTSSSTQLQPPLPPPRAPPPLSLPLPPPFPHLQTPSLPH